MTTPHIRFGTVGSPQTTPGTGTPAAIEHIHQLGLEHLEIAWTRSVQVSDATCAIIKEAAQAHGVTLSVHAPYFINLNSQTAEKMEKSDARLVAAATAGYKCGARDIVFHPGSYHKQDPAEVYPRVRDQLASIVERLRADGVDVTLRPEAMGKSAVMGTLEEVVQLAADVDGVLPCIDWAHLYARTGDGSYNSREQFEASVALMRDKLGDDALHRVHFHISGIAYTPKGERAHIPMYESPQRFVDILETWVANGLSGTVGVEAPEPFHTADALTLQAMYRHIRDRVAEAT